MSRAHAIPGTVTEDWDWQQRGLCRGLDSAMFFHPDGERGHARAHRVDRAKQLCAQCPVLLHCREHALAVAEPYGIWGGLSESERATMLKSERADDPRRADTLTASRR